MSSVNPLLDIMKATRRYVTLPSEGKFYNSEVLDNTYEIGVSSMSAKDEIMFKNPEALMNGQAVMNLIKNCTVGIKKPEQLNHVDVEALLLGIKSASGESSIEYNVSCPSCEHKGSMELNIESTLEQMTRLKDSYSYELDNGIKIELVPHSYLNHINILTLAFQQKTLIQIGQQSDNEDVHKQLLSEMRDILTEMKFNNVLFAIDKVIYNDNIIDDPLHIKEFVEVLPSKDFSQVESLINEFSEYGVSNIMYPVCSECGHEWEQSLSKFDPTGFFSERSVTQNYNNDTNS